MDFTDIASALAERAGILDKYVAAVNRGAAGTALRDRNGRFDYALDESKPPTRDEVWSAFAKAASHELSDGEEVHDLDWVKANGLMQQPFPQLGWYRSPRHEQ